MLNVKNYIESSASLGQVLMQYHPDHTANRYAEGSERDHPGFVLMHLLSFP